MNAFTSKEHTCYYARVLDRDLPLAIDVICDIVTSAAAAGRGRGRRAWRDPRGDRHARRRSLRPGARRVHGRRCSGPPTSAARSWAPTRPSRRSAATRSRRSTGERYRPRGDGGRVRPAASTTTRSCASSTAGVPVSRLPWATRGRARCPPAAAARRPCTTAGLRLRRRGRPSRPTSCWACRAWRAPTIAATR